MRSGRSKVKAGEDKEIHEKLLSARSDSRNLHRRTADRTARRFGGDVAVVSGREPHAIFRVKLLEDHGYGQFQYGHTENNSMVSGVAIGILSMPISLPVF